jgi:hypothetical protein
MKGLDDWLAEPYENQRDAEYEECPECFGTGLYTPRVTAGDEYLHGEIVLDDCCEECGGEGQVEVDVEERDREQRESAAADAAEERYYHDKYGD